MNHNIQILLIYVISYMHIYLRPTCFVNVLQINLESTWMLDIMYFVLREILITSLFLLVRVFFFFVN
jgi:hypothetical protein